MKADLRLAVPVLCGWILLGILIGEPSWLGTGATWLWVLCVAAIGAGFAFSGFRGWLAVLALAGVCGALLLTSASLQLQVHAPDLLLASLGQQESFEVSIESSNCRPAEESGNGRTEVIIRSFGTESDSVGGLSTPAVLFGNISDCRLGASFTVTGILRPEELRRRWAFRIYATSNPVLVERPGGLIAVAGGLREGLGSAAAELNSEAGDLLPGLAIGDTSEVSESLNAAMRLTSLSHLTAVSGANCAVLVGLTMAICIATGIPRTLRLILSLLVLGGFVVLVTPESSVVRAAVMAAIVLYCIGSGRPSRGIPVLALAVLILLIANPWLACDYGFILSVAATAGLLILAAPIGRQLSRFLPNWLALILAIPIAAQLSCQPILILLNPNLPVYGVVANLLAEPAAPVATVLGLAACVFLALIPPLGSALLWLASFPSAWIAAVAQFLSSLPAAQLPWLEGWPGVISVALIDALILVALAGRNTGRRAIALGITALIFIGYAGVAFGIGLSFRLDLPGDWTIATCDVGQGDALVVKSLDRVALIDVGPEPQALSRCLVDLGIDKINLLVLTHYDLDHVGGLETILGRVDLALTGPIGSSTDSEIVDRLSRSGARVEAARAGMSGSLGELDWKLLWPIDPNRGVEPGNDSSVVIKFSPSPACSSGCISSIFLGDLGAQSQLRLLGEGGIGSADVVKVAHHGSADQFAALYQKIGAPIGLISVGAGNSFGHPNEACLDILEESGTKWFRTDLEGLVLLSGPDSSNLRVWTERAPVSVPGSG
ncbi:MAG: ComEC/Rec2 family competence protein [Cryobacterium sp.]|nr:ComEC/Rec2 family competence protein [Cryobacterium sp.]